MHGRWLSTQFFRRYWKGLLAITVVLVMYIATRYQCVSEMERVQELEHKLAVVKSEQIRQKALYMSNIRESTMDARVKSMGLDLKMRERPPYRIKRIPAK